MVVCTQEKGGQCKREGRFALKTDHASVSHTAVPDRSVHETANFSLAWRRPLIFKPKGMEVAFWLPLPNVFNLFWGQVLLFVDS